MQPEELDKFKLRELSLSRTGALVMEYGQADQGGTVLLCRFVIPRWRGETSPDPSLETGYSHDPCLEGSQIRRPQLPSRLIYDAQQWLSERRRCLDTNSPQALRSLIEDHRLGLRLLGDVEAEVELLTTQAGGRAYPATSGYRPQHLILPDYLTSGEHHYLDKHTVYPGERVRARITFISPEAYPCSLRVGSSMKIQEGSRVVGRAVMTRILNPDLARV